MKNRTEQQLDKILQMPGSPRASEQSIMLSSSTAIMEQTKALMKQTACFYPAQELTPEAVTMWAPLWIEAAEKYGMRALTDAVREHQRRSEFFPMPSKLLDIIKEQQAERRQEQSAKQVKRVDRPLTKQERIRRFGERHPFAQMDDDTVECVDRCYGAEAARQYKAQLEHEAEQVQRTA